MSGYGNAQPMEARTSVPDRHLAAVTRSLQWAQDSADRGDYADAIAWHRAVEATGDELSPAQRTKHQAWRVALVHSEAARRRFWGTVEAGTRDDVADRRAASMRSHPSYPAITLPLN
jgi:hypothetical protein